MASSRSLLLQLPSELQHLIWSELRPDDLLSVARACRSLHDALRDTEVWLSTVGMHSRLMRHPRGTKLHAFVDAHLPDWRMLLRPHRTPQLSGAISKFGCLGLWTATMCFIMCGRIWAQMPLAERTSCRHTSGYSSGSAGGPEVQRLSCILESLQLCNNTDHTPPAQKCMLLSWAASLGATHERESRTSTACSSRVLFHRAGIKGVSLVFDWGDIVAVGRNTPSEWAVLETLLPQLVANWRGSGTGTTQRMPCQASMCCASRTLPACLKTDLKCQIPVARACSNAPHLIVAWCGSQVQCRCGWHSMGWHHGKGSCSMIRRAWPSLVG